MDHDGIRCKLPDWVKDFLSERTQQVVINGESSSKEKVTCGVPQGTIRGPLLFLIYINDIPDRVKSPIPLFADDSYIYRTISNPHDTVQLQKDLDVLGPLLFLVYINDLERNIKSNVKFFADDTMLFSIVNNPELSAIDLNHDLGVIHQWAHQWKLEFNPDPNKQATEVLFSCKTSSPNHPHLMFNGTVVTKKNEQKHLGFILDSNLSFKKHINEKFIKAKKNLGIIKHLSFFLPRKALDQMYKAVVRSHFDYCDVLYHIPSMHTQLGMSLTDLMEQAERIQYQAALAITGAWQGSSRSKLYEELGWESLSERRWCRRILQIHKIVSNKTPSYLKDKLPRYRRPLYSQNNNYNNTFHEIKCRSSRYMNSFFPNAITAWNNVITHFDNIPSINILKDHILSLIRPKKKENLRHT